MWLRRGVFLLLLAAVLLFVHEAQAAKIETPIGWGYARAGPVELRARPNSRKPGFLRLGRGAVVSVLRVESRGGTEWARVRALDLASLTAQAGWVESNRIELLPLARLPSDAELLEKLGGDYLDDFTREHTEVVRLLVRQSVSEPTLVCFVVSRAVAAAKLVAFFPLQGKLAPGPGLDFPSSEMQAGIIAAEARDLTGDASEFLITREPFRLGPETRGINIVVRKIEGGTFRTLWQAPLEYRSLESYLPRLQILQPPERNIGAAGTVTTGEVTFRPCASGYEPVWKGKVEFYAVGREQPRETLTIEKVCPWQGDRFAPLR